MGWRGFETETAERVYQVFQNFFRKHELPKLRQGPWLIAVSGGADSMTLLHLAYRFASSHGYVLAVAHVHHGLRVDADLDQSLVHEVCERLEIPYYATRVALSQLPVAQRNGIEADARKLRYRALVATAKEVGASTVLLGHHAGDQVETVLWRLLRGTSLQGLGGMRPVRMEHGLQWVRPLLEIEASAIRTYTVRYQVPFREDSTNADLDYTRNYIRHEVLPTMRGIQPHLGHTVARLTQLLQEDEGWLQQEAQRAVEHCAKIQGERYKLDLPCFATFARPLQRRAIKIILYCLASEDWSFLHVESILELCTSARPSASLSMPAGLGVWREYDHLWIGRALHPGEAKTSSQPFDTTWELKDGAHLAWPVEGAEPWHFTCRVRTQYEPVQRGSPYELVLPLLPSVTLRRVQTSERLAQLGVDGTKKVQDIFTDLKIPRTARAAWPGIYVEGKLIWLPGLRRSRELLVHPERPTGWMISAWQGEGMK